MRFLGYLFACGLCLVSCTIDEFEGNYSAEDVPLSISVGTNIYNMKSGQDEDDYYANALGISVSDESGVKYGGRDYNNVLYEKVGDVWKTDDDVMLSALEGKLNAYWPYDPEVNSLRSVPVSAFSQTDYLYAETVEGLSKHSSEAFIRFRHALSAIRLTLVKGSYVGAGNVTEVQVRSDRMPVLGVLDAFTGDVNAEKGFGQPVEVGVEIGLLMTPQSHDVFLLPTEGEHRLDISVMVDGQKREVSVEGVTLPQGVMTSIVLVVNDCNLVVTGVVLQDWTFDANQFQVHIGGNTAGVAFSHSVDNEGVVTITAVPVEQSCAVDQVSVQGLCQYEQCLDAETGVRTLVLRELQEDVILKFNGAWSTVFHQEFNIKPENVGEDVLLFRADCYSQMTGMLEYMEIDGDRYPLSQYFKFTQPGLHKVNVFMPLDKEINVSGGSQRHLVSVEVPYCTKVLKANAFSDSPFLERVVVPGSVSEIGSYAFAYCETLESVKLGVGLKIIGYSAFSSCISLRDISLPLGLEKISPYAFSGCASVLSMRLPQTVMSVGVRAFKGCTSLEELTFCKGDSEVITNGPILENCNSLVAITLPANHKRNGLICANCPVLSTINTYGSTCPMRVTASDYAFYGVSSSGVLSIPQGALNYETWIEELGPNWRFEYLEEL